MPECPDCGAEMELVDPATTPGGTTYECLDCCLSSSPDSKGVTDP